MPVTSRLFLVAACATACARAPSPSSETNATVASSTARGGATPVVSAIADARVLSCSFGGVGPQSLPPATNLWVAIVVEVSGGAGDVRGVTVDGIELRDEGGRVTARGIAPTIVVVPSTHAPTDFSATDGTPFDGSVLAGARVRLLVHGALDVRMEAIKPPMPSRVHFTLADDHANRTRVEGVAVGPWPTA